MNGFFSPEAMAALQEAYQMQLTPDEMDIDQVTGLPTNQVSNTAPWHGTVELWKYPNGVTPTKQGEIHYIPQEVEAEEEDLEELIDSLDEEDEESDSIEEMYEDNSDDDDSEPMTEDEVDALIQELLESDEDD